MKFELPDHQPLAFYDGAKGRSFRWGIFVGLLTGVALTIGASHFPVKQSDGVSSKTPDGTPVGDPPNPPSGVTSSVIPPDPNLPPRR